MEECGDGLHLVNGGEFEAGLAILDTLVDENDRVMDHEALKDIRASLEEGLDTLPRDLVMRRRYVLSVIEQLDSAEKAFCLKGNVAR